jgi:hypothetical protein
MLGFPMDVVHKSVGGCWSHNPNTGNTLVPVSSVAYMPSKGSPFRRFPSMKGKTKRKGSKQQKHAKAVMTWSKEHMYYCRMHGQEMKGLLKIYLII